MKHRPNYALLAILAVALILRIVFWSQALLGRDAIGYAIGGLGTWCAHSPGYFGYCFSGWLVNQVVANINDSFVLINVVTSLLGIYFCYRLAESFGLKDRNAVLATAAYAFSINLDYFSVVALSFAPEGMFATLFALICHRAIKDQSFRLTLLATVIWAVSGAFRQTSISFLAPLWLYTLWASGPLKRVPLYVLVAIPIILAWSRPNAYYQKAYGGDLQADVSRSFWTLQVYTGTNYDQSNFGVDKELKQNVTGGYHWPFIEALQIVDEKTGIHFLPDYRSYGAPPPSLAHAAKLSALQFTKLTFYMLFSLPCLLILLILLPQLKKVRSLFRPGEIPFLLAWMLPVGGFFIIGHFGSFGYLQIFLSGFSVLTVLLLSRAGDPMEGPGWRRWQYAHAFLTAAALAFFIFARPYRSSDAQEKLTDVLVLQYTGPAIHHLYTVARWLVVQPGPAREEDWFRLETDAELIRWFSSSPMAERCLYKPHTVR